MSDNARTAHNIRLGIIVAVLVALGLGSFWVLEVVRRDGTNAQSERVPNKPDYYVEKFNYVKMAESGQPRFSITGDKMVHFPQDDSFEITMPVITGLDPSKPTMDLRSKRARIEDDNSKVHMYDDVNGNRAATSTSENMHLKTEYLLVLPDDDIAKTDKYAEVTMGSSFMTGTGMIVNDAIKQLEFLHDFHGYYEPRPKDTGTAAQPVKK